MIDWLFAPNPEAMRAAAEGDWERKKATRRELKLDAVPPCGAVGLAQGECLTKEKLGQLVLGMRKRYLATPIDELQHVSTTEIATHNRSI